MEKSLTFEYTAPYHTLGELNAQTRRIWLVCHGYGQLAAYFIKKFEVLDRTGNYVIAPQGLSRFYQQGMSGRVGASWMTREARETEIRNYLTYLNSVYAQETAGKDLSNLQVVVLGFSQGVATATRWVAAGKVKADRLILWAGAFPGDVAVESPQCDFRKLPLTMVYGNADELISADHLKAHLSELQAKAISPQVIQFDGGHDLDTAVLAAL